MTSLQESSASEESSADWTYLHFHEVSYGSSYTRHALMTQAIQELGRGEAAFQRIEHELQEFSCIESAG